MPDRYHRIKVSAVCYSNTVPFLYGLQHSPIHDEIDISIDIPSLCASKLQHNEVSISLVPVAIIPQLKYYKFISEYCIGAIKRVKSVILASNVKLEDINKIYLDYQSVTSVALVKVFAKLFWNINVEWENTQPGFESTVIHDSNAAVIIGDRTFAAYHQFNYIYDLAEEWNKYTGLPFVFAVWLTNTHLNKDFEQRFNTALQFGIQNIEAAAKSYADSPIPTNELIQYLTNDISYPLDDSKKKGMNLFLDYLKDL